MIVEIKNINDLNENSWNKLLEDSPQSTVYHTKSWAEVWEKSYPKSHSFFITATDEKGNYLAGMPIWQKEKFGLKSLFSMPFGTYGGLIKKKEIDKSISYHIYERLEQMFKGQRIIKAQFIDFFSSNDYLQNIGFSPLKYFTHLILLYQIDENDHLQIFSRKRREGIRQSQRRGVKVKDIRSLEDIPRCYQLWMETSRRHNNKSPKYPFKLFENIFTIMGRGDLLKWLIALKGERIIGSLINFVFKDTLYAWGGGSDFKELNARPNDALFLYSILWAKRKGLRLFNFGATPEGAEGMIKFKESWGALRKEYLIYEKKKRLGKLLEKIKSIS
jgi:predicted N-acyltransferase